MMLPFPFKYRKLSDEELVVRISGNDDRAFEELYDRYSRRILNYFYRMLGKDTEKAQDFLQDIFLKILHHAGMFQPSQKFTTWIYTIAHNMCRNEYRKMSVRSNAVVNGEIATTEHTDEEMARTEQAIDTKMIEKAVYREIANLDEAHRSTFILRFQENLSIKEISNILNCSEGTTKSRLYYTTKDLNYKLQEYNPV
jgi:RNA polymerase sigma-70 factor (ECF subfamily)